VTTPGTVQWFRTRKRSLYRDIRALNDFTAALAAVTRILERADQWEDPVGEMRGALFMAAVVTYVRPFVGSNTKDGQKSFYGTKYLKPDARFDLELHRHLIDLRNKLIAHDDEEVLSPEVHALNIKAENGENKGEKIVAMRATSYAFSSASGGAFMAKVRSHLEGCVDAVKSKLHRDLLEHLSAAQGHPEIFQRAAEPATPPRGELRFSIEPKMAPTFLSLDDLRTKLISIPKGPLHKEEYTYRVIWYEASARETEFNVGPDLVHVHFGTPPARPATEKNGLWVVDFIASKLRRIVDWGNEPFVKLYEQEKSGKPGD
jgi:hypothetical protein